MGNAKLINYNYAQLSETLVSASSSNVNFPVANLKHEFRNKTWRTSGHFLVNASNNKIDFKESAMGSELTATIAAGTYTPATLAAEIKSQLEAVGAANYTVSFSYTSGLWTITSDGAYFSLLLNTGTHSTQCLLVNSLGFNNSDNTGSLSYTGANIAIHTSEWAVFDLRTIEEIDSVCLLWPKSDGIKLSSTAEIRVQANATNEWSSPAVNQVLNIDNTYEVASHFFTTNQNYRYWRVQIIDPANANLYLELGTLVLGKGLDIVEPDKGFEYELNDESKITSNQFGNQFVDVYPLKATLSLKYGLLEYDEATQLEIAYRQNGNRKPVLFVVDYSDSVFSKNHFLIYGKMIKPSKLSQLNYKYFSSDLVIEECS